MKKTVFKLAALLLAVCTAMPIFTSCAGKSENQVIIYTAAEDYRVKSMQDSLNAKFPDYDIRVEYMTTGNLAAKSLSEKANTEADILYDVEYSYLSKMDKEGVLANLDGKYDMSKYTDDAVISNNYIPESREALAIIINEDILKQKNLKEPESYQDLLDPQYKGLISMANPKSSGTGYSVLLSLVNAMGEKEAIDYFDKLTPNMLEYTSSGAGPVNALSNGEVAIGIGMTFQGVKKINEGSHFKIKYFKEGSPFALYGQAIIKGKETRPAVKAVFDYLVDTFEIENCKNFCPEKILKDKDFATKNYPTDIKYADMKNNTPENKEHILSLWKY